MGEVVIADIDTRLPLPAERILDGARDADLTEVLLLGWEPDGRFYCAGTHDDLGGHLVLLERAKLLLLGRLEEAGE